MGLSEKNQQGRLKWSALFVLVAAVPAWCQGHVDAADQRIRFAQAQLARDPEFWTNYNRLASAYAQKARETGDISYFVLAETALERSLTLEATHEEAAPAFAQIATVHLAEHRFREAGEDAAKAIALMPGDLSAAVYAGDAQMEVGRYAEAQRFYDRLAAPADGKPHPGLAFLAASHGASLRWVEGKVAKANEDLTRAVELAKQLHLPAENVAWTEFMLGEQYFLQGDLGGAEREEAAALAAFAGYHRALAAMGQIRAAQGRMGEAVEYYKRAIALIPLPAYVAALGDVSTAMGERGAAEKQYGLVEYIGKLSAINQQVYNRELAVFYADHDRRLEESLALARKELEVRQDVYTWDALAWTLVKNHQAREAAEAMEKALRMGTRDAVMEYHAGVIAGALGDRVKEEMHLRRALGINLHFHVLFGPLATMRVRELEGAAGR